jgi:hypothetical protein
MPAQPNDLAQARREAATLLGIDIEHLSAADSLRVDMVSALRLVTITSRPPFFPVAAAISVG